MIEIKNLFYTQRFFADSLRRSDFYHAVTYTDYGGKWSDIPFYYKKIYGHTAHIDLTQDIESLFSNIKSSVRNEIRRGEKEGCVVEFGRDYKVFVPFYNKFCEDKGISEFKTNVANLTKYDYILISKVSCKSEILCMHATLIDEESHIAMLMYSCSQRLKDGVNRNLIGWGNRYLHYKEFEFFKDLGMAVYEWNGVNIDSNSPEKMSIGKFKLGFGGIEENIISLRTPLFLLLKALQNCFNKILRR